MTARGRKQAQPETTGFVKLLLVNTPAIVTVLVLAAGFYATTQWRLNDIDGWRKEESQEHKVVQDKLTAIKEADDASRERVRTEFFRRQDETNKTLGELDKKLAISETKQQQMVDVLKDISAALGRSGKK